MDLFILMVLLSLCPCVDRVCGLFFLCVTYLILYIYFKAEWKVAKKLKITLCSHYMSQLGGGKSANYSMFLSM